MFEDLRQFLTSLEADGDLQRIRIPVDREWEVGTVTREVFDQHGPALLFERVGDFSTPLAVGVLGTRERYAKALAVQPTIAALSERWHKAYATPIPPKVVTEGPCKETVLTEIDFCTDPFPVPRWHEGDGFYMLGTYHTVITRDPETGVMNLGTYRNAIFERNILGIAFQPHRHISQHWNKWKQLGKSMPVAIAIGLDPYVALVTISPVPPGIDDYAVAGGLKGAPIEVIKAETSDLLVPARAEIIIEGEIPPDLYPSGDGPFGEYMGYVASRTDNRRPYIRATRVTHRENPIFQGTYEGRPPNESTMVRAIGASMTVKEHLERSGFRESPTFV